MRAAVPAKMHCAIGTGALRHRHILVGVPAQVCYGTSTDALRYTSALWYRYRRATVPA